MLSQYTQHKRPPIAGTMILFIMLVGNATQSQDSISLVRDFPASFGRFIVSPLDMEEAQWPLWAGGITATGLLIYHDEKVMRNVRVWGEAHPELAHSASYVTALGNGYATTAVCGLVYLGGYLVDDPYLSNTGMICTQSLIASSLTVTLLKVAFSRQRPTVNGQSKWFMYDDNLASWPGSSTYMSFPSGHTIVAWSVASAIAHRYPKRLWIQFLCYGAASAVGFSRVLLNKHWPGDVMAGALIGFGAGRFFARRGKGKQFFLKRKRGHFSRNGADYLF